MEEAISLGWNCESAGKGVESGIRRRKGQGYNTCPFDEMITSYEGIMLCLKEDFKHLCDPAYLTLIPAKFSTGGIVENERLLYNTRYKFIFNHESPDHANLYINQNWPGGKMHYIDNNYEKFIERYTRRINSFREYVNNSSLITFIIGKFNPDVTELQNLLKELYPNLMFNIFWYTPSVPEKLFNDHHTLMQLCHDTA